MTASSGIVRLPDLDLTLTETSPPPCLLGQSVPRLYLPAYYVWKNLNTWKWRYAPIVHFTLRKRTRMTYSEGLSFLHTQSTRSGVGPFTRKSDWYNGTEKVEFRFRRQRKVCRVIDEVGYPHDTPTDTFRWKPWNFTGGNKPVTDSTYYKCNYDKHYYTYISDPISTTNGHSMKYGASFNIVGVKLSAMQTTGTSEELSASVKSGYSRAVICGHGGAPAVAGLFWEEPS